jgi:ribosomal-protein-alanine N-acetyltransferase
MIETEKLDIIPLNSVQLNLFIKKDPSLKDALGLHEMQHSFSQELLETLEHSIIPKTASQKYNAAFVCLWIIVHKKTRAVIGDIFFKGEPDDKGEIEIGYETYLPYRRQGYMTEAVGGMIQWAMQEKELKSIFAEADSNNLGSLKVLEKNNFALLHEKRGRISFRLKLAKKN